MTSPALTAEELAAILAAVEPSVVLVPAPVLRRVVRHDRGFLGLPLQVPHRKTYLIAADTLLRLSTPEELGIDPARQLTGNLTLLVRPEDFVLQNEPRGAILLEYWRLLFHAQVHRVLEERWARGDLTLKWIQHSIQRIGEAEFRGACIVLKQEQLLLPPDDNRNTFIEFVAVYLELKYFAATLLPSYFPSLRHDEELAATVDADDLFRRTRIPGAPDPSPPAETSSEEPLAYFRKLVRDADEASSLGNVVRAAVRRTQAARVAPAAEEPRTLARAQIDVDALVQRVHAVVGSGAETAPRWKRVLLELLDKSDQGPWPQEARLLYDLQQACVSGEQEVYRVSVLHWLQKAGRREPLTNQRDMRVSNHLERAIGRLPYVRLSVEDRAELSGLLRSAQSAVEGRLRLRIRPVLEQAFVESGLRPSCIPEEVVFAKVLDELLDRLMARSFLTFSDIRDAISTNQLKLPDLDHVHTLWSGDALLQIDRRLRTALAGVYRHGEPYRSLLEKASALLSSTPKGRLVVWLLLLPLGGGIALWFGLGHLVHGAWAWIARSDAPPPSVLWPIPALAVVLGLLINHRPTRAAAGRLLGHVGRFLRAVLIEVPRALAGVPQVRWLLQNDVFMGFVRYVLRPGIITVVVALVAWAVRRPFSFLHDLLVFLCTALLLNSRPWRGFEEGAEESVFRGWRFLARGLFPGLFRFVMAVFKRIHELLEAVVYTVDEWLSYRTGEGRTTLWLKAILSPLWLPVSFTLRFVFDVCIEPRFNPIKYVSVVMIIDKITIVFTPQGRIWIKGMFTDMGLGSVTAETLTWILLYMIPAAMGFLIWELKENWRLYRANRAAALRPESLSLDGESFQRLLRSDGRRKLPGLFARLRRAEREAHRTGSWAESRRQRAALEDLRGAIRQFMSRSFLRFLERSPSMVGLSVRIRDVRLGLNQIGIELGCEAHPETAVRIEFEGQSGWLIASVPESGWLCELTERQRTLFKLALLGLFKMTGVDIVREQVASHLAEFRSLSLVYDLTPEGLKVWPADRFEAAAIVDLHAEGAVRPQPIFHPTPLALPPLASDRMLFAGNDLPWETWVKAWEDDAAGREILLPPSIDLPLSFARPGTQGPAAASSDEALHGVEHKA